MFWREKWRPLSFELLHEIENSLMEKASRDRNADIRKGVQNGETLPPWIYSGYTWPSLSENVEDQVWNSPSRFGAPSGEDRQQGDNGPELRGGRPSSQRPSGGTSGAVARQSKSRTNSDFGSPIHRKSRERIPGALPH